MPEIAPCSAIILETYPIKDAQWRTVAFTRELGLLSFFSKGAKAPAVALSEIELLLIEKNDTFRLKEIKVINPHLKLRQDLLVLSSAIDMLKITKKNLGFQHPIPQIYDLLRYYYERLPSFPTPQVLKQSFLLKLLLAEGVLSFPVPGNFSDEEQDWMIVLAGAKALQELMLIPFNSDFDERLLCLL